MRSKCTGPDKPVLAVLSQLRRRRTATETALADLRRQRHVALLAHFDNAALDSLEREIERRLQQLDQIECAEMVLRSGVQGLPTRQSQSVADREAVAL